MATDKNKENSKAETSIPEKTFSVTEFIEFLNIFFKQHKFRVVGEISQFKRQIGSGHCYFTIKDKDRGSVMDCIMWGRNYDLYGVDLEVGMEVILTGRPNIYSANGRLSFVADAVELVGEGALKKAYLALKKKLEEEGLFAESKKRPIPQFVQKIGVITSLQGAVISDFKQNLGKFGFKVLLADSRVEGQTALEDLHAAINLMRKQGVEVLVIIRGGGSLESLQAFNNESLVREIADFPVPVIAGIGHDEDVPLIALAADRMTSTPTAAAHLLSQSWEEAYAKIKQVPYLLTRVSQEFKRIRADLDTSWSSMIDHTAQEIQNQKEKLIFAEKAIRLNDPVRQLKLGYSIVRQNDKIIRSTHEIKIGDKLNTQFIDGTIQSIVESK